MMLTLDVGNSQIFGGVFLGESLTLQFRMSSGQASTSDEYGLFLRNILKENEIDFRDIKEISLCSVVPDKIHSLKNGCRKYFDMEPFILQAGVKTGLQIKYHNPLEVGSDRIADAMAATHLYPNTNLIVIDFGTATTIEAISAKREFLGGAILPGLRISMEMLEQRTSRLPSVEIVKGGNVVGRSTTESIQSGLYYGHYGSVREILRQTTLQAFNGKQPKVIGTGGFASLFAGTDLFDKEVPELVLKGLFLAKKMNENSKGEKS